MRTVRLFAAALVLILTGVAGAPAQAASAPERIPRDPRGPRPPVPRVAPPPADMTGYTLLAYRLPVTGPRPPRWGTITGPTRADIDGDRIDEIVIGSSGAVFVDYSRLGRTDLIQPSVRDNRTLGFGDGVATGDFNGDGYDDLAVSNPRDDGVRRDFHPVYGPIVRNADAGGLWIIPGGPDGLRVEQARHFTQDTPGVPSLAAANELFGWTVAAGDLNGDGRDDLAVHTLDERDSGASNAGAVTILYGSLDGLTPTGALQLNQAMPAVPGEARESNYFGIALAIGNVTGDRYADLVVGASGDNEGILWSPDHAGTGKLFLFKGSAGGLSQTGVQQVTAWAAGQPTEWPDPILQFLGSDVAIADLTGDGFGDVVTTAPVSQVGNVMAGAILMVRGTSSGLTLTGRQVISENSPGVPGTSESEQWFGAGGVRLGDVTGDGRPDVLISSHSKRIGNQANAGQLLLLPGTAAGIGTSGARLFDQTTVGGLCGPAANEYFGRYIALLNLDGGGALDALVTTGHEMSCGVQDGVVTVLGGGSGTLTGYGTVSSHTYRPGFFSTNFGQLP